MRPHEVELVIRALIRKPLEFPAIFVWGGPGIGKSSVAKKAAEDEKVNFLDIRALLLDPTDLRGIPIPEGDKARWLSPSFLPTDEKSRGLMFFDELPLAPVLVQNSILQLVLDRKLGEYVLPLGWGIIAAGNRPEETIGTYRMPPPLANRFAHITYDIKDETDTPFVDDGGVFNPDWVVWALKNDIHPAIISFLSRIAPEFIYMFDPTKDGIVSRTRLPGFPTPRSWEFASKILKSDIPDQMKEPLMEGAIGATARKKFAVHLQFYHKVPDPERIFKGEDIIPKELDIMFATCTSLVVRASKQEHYNRLLDYLMKLQREFGIYMLRMLANKNQTMLENSSNWSKVASQLVVKEKMLG